MAGEQGVEGCRTYSEEEAGGRIKRDYSYHRILTLGDDCLPMKSRIKYNLFSAIGMLSILLFSCNADPAQRLNDEVMNADRIEMKILINGELVEGIKFAYSTEEEKFGLLSDLSELKTVNAECLEEIGAFEFFVEDKSTDKLKFNATDDCAFAWFGNGMNGKAFILSDSLNSLLQQRYQMVSAVKGQAQ